MIKRIVFVLGLLCIGAWSWGQSNVQFVNTNPSKTPFENLWMSRYTHEASVGEVVSVDLELRKNGQLVYRATSNPITLNSRFQLLNPRLSGLEKETFLDRQTGMFIRNSNMLPSGSYTACVIVNGRNERAGSNLDARACIEFAIELDARLRLMHIPNGEEVSRNELPMFSWSFLAPSANVSEIEYTLTVCEIFEGQSKEEAVLRNMPMLVEKELMASSFQYPLEARSLEIDKQYAWCVQARTGDMLLATSEVWSFSIEKTEEKKRKNVSMPYLDLEDIETSERVNIKGYEFNIKIDYSQRGAREINFEIVDAKGRSVKPQLSPMEVSYGSNYLSLDLSELKKLKTGKEYQLVIVGLEETNIEVPFLYL
mgnify:CR=1 FL=1